MKILVVDDVGYSRHFHTRLLQKFGYETEVAETGPQALKLLERDKAIDVVLTDLMMREMDGVELFQRVLQSTEGEPAGLPAFVLMTALRPGNDQSQQKDLEKVRRAKDIGFVDVLYKPIEPEALRNTLETIILARSQTLVDYGDAVRKTSAIVDRLIAASQFDVAAHFLDEMRQQLERLETFAAQPA